FRPAHSTAFYLIGRSYRDSLAPYLEASTTERLTTFPGRPTPPRCRALRSGRLLCRSTPNLVIPAKAGTQSALACASRSYWIPGFRGNDEGGRARRVRLP